MILFMLEYYCYQADLFEKRIKSSIESLMEVLSKVGFDLEMYFDE